MKKDSDKSIQTIPEGGDMLAGCGFKSENLAATNLAKLAPAFLDRSAKDTGGISAAMELALVSLTGMKPEDYSQSMVSAQAITAHGLAMEFMNKALLSEDFEWKAAYVSYSERLMNAFGRHLTLLNKLQGKGNQRVVVEHVHVHQGGQAIVAGELVSIPREGSQNRK